MLGLLTDKTVCGVIFYSRERVEQPSLTEDFISPCWRSSGRCTLLVALLARALDTWPLGADEAHGALREPARLNCGLLRTKAAYHVSVGVFDVLVVPPSADRFAYGLNTHENIVQDATALSMARTWKNLTSVASFVW